MFLFIIAFFCVFYIAYLFRHRFNRSRADSDLSTVAPSASLPIDSTPLSVQHETIHTQRIPISPANTSHHSHPIISSPTHTHKSHSSSNTTTRPSHQRYVRYRRSNHASYAEAYGFVLWILTFFTYIVFMLWAFLPTQWLFDIGVTYFPSK